MCKDKSIFLEHSDYVLVSQEVKLSTQVQQLKVEELSEVKDVGQTKGGDHDQVVGELHTEDLRQKTLEEQFPLAKARGPPCSQLL